MRSCPTSRPHLRSTSAVFVVIDEWYVPVRLKNAFTGARKMMKFGSIDPSQIRTIRHCWFLLGGIYCLPTTQYYRYDLSRLTLNYRPVGWIECEKMRFFDQLISISRTVDFPSFLAMVRERKHRRIHCNNIIVRTSARCYRSYTETSHRSSHIFRTSFELSLDSVHVNRHRARASSHN